jgi:GTPase
MLIDEVDISVKAGHGGAGRVSFGANGPDGGNGGRGGNVYIKVTTDLKALNKLASNSEVFAADGNPGTNRRSFGKKGDDVMLKLPIGCSVLDLESGETLELDTAEQEYLICKGGLGGRGNLEFKSSTNRSPMYAQPGLPGEAKKLRIVLRFIADYGLVGLPNAGKSSLLNELTNANAEVGAYPFTTLEANLGAFGSAIIADIPGLIEGASNGRGLGTKFLKHIEKVKMLLHCISVDSEDVLGDFETINQELLKFNPILTTKDRIVLLTKTDLVDKKIIAKQTKNLSKLGYPILPVSVFDLESVEGVKNVLRSRK